jgi:hypothetical protein
MQFRVPQFIDIEDKILGPLTWKQAAYCLGGAGVTYLALRFTGSKILGLLIAAPFLSVFMSLAFVKINNQNFIEVMENAFNYFSKSNLYTWQKDKNPQVEEVSVSKSSDKEITEIYKKKTLSEIASGLDTKME